MSFNLDYASRLFLTMGTGTFSWSQGYWKFHNRLCESVSSDMTVRYVDFERTPFQSRLCELFNSDPLPKSLLFSEQDRFNLDYASRLILIAPTARVLPTVLRFNLGYASRLILTAFWPMTKRFGISAVSISTMRVG